MAVRTGREYVDSLRSRRPVVYLNGNLIDNLVDHPEFQPGINSLSVTFDAAHDPALRELSVAHTDDTEPTSRWTSLQTSMEDALIKTRLMRALGETGCACHYRCLTTDALNAAWATSWEIDKKYGTEYHQRVRRLTEQAQREDWAIGACIVDPRGDRRYRPVEQPDPDMFLHIVERREDGIVVRGAKAHSTASAYTNMLAVFPSTPLQPDEKDYAVAFFTPTDTAGLSFVCKEPPSPRESHVYEFPLSSKYGQLECFVLFEDVFVPWENVYLAGEYEFAGFQLGVFNSFHTWHKCACRAATMDLDIGALALVCEYNGTDAAPHIRDYLVEMMMATEIVYSCAVSAAAQGKQHESGVFVPYRAAGNSGKVYAAHKLGEDRYYLQEAAGGLVGTMSGEKDLLNPETAELLKKYLRTREDVSVEDRIRAFKLVEDLTASRWAGWYHAMCISGGATPSLLKQRVFMDTDLAPLKRRAKRIAGIAE